MPTRRALLTAAVVLPLAACTDEPSPPEPVDPDVALRQAAVERELRLIGAYDAALARSADPRLLGLREEHVQHLQALGAQLPSPSPSPTPPRATALPAAERAAAAGHARDAVTASRELAALLASLAASEASHVVALS